MGRTTKMSSGSLRAGLHIDVRESSSIRVQPELFRYSVSVRREGGCGRTSSCDGTGQFTALPPSSHAWDLSMDPRPPPERFSVCRTSQASCEVLLRQGCSAQAVGSPARRCSPSADIPPKTPTHLSRRAVSHPGEARSESRRPSLRSLPAPDELRGLLYVAHRRSAHRGCKRWCRPSRSSD